MKDLAINRDLNAGTIHQVITIHETYYALHTTKDEVIITDAKDFSKIYAVSSMEFYAQLMFDKLRNLK